MDKIEQVEKTINRVRRETTQKNARKIRHEGSEI
jgi:hypothetical protein